MDDETLERAYQEGARYLERYGSLPSWRELPQGAKDALAGAVEGGREELREDVREVLTDALAEAADEIVDAVLDELEDVAQFRQALTRILENVGKAVENVR